MWRKPTWLSTMVHGTCYRLAQQKAMKAPFICLLHRTESYVTLRYVTFRECLVLVFVFLTTPFCERIVFFCSWKYIIESEVWKSTVLTDKNLASIYAGSFDCRTFAVFLFTLTFITHQTTCLSCITNSKATTSSKRWHLTASTYLWLIWGKKLSRNQKWWSWWTTSTYRSPTLRLEKVVCSGVGHFVLCKER